MSHDYHDAVDNARLDAAARLLRRRSLEAPSAAVGELVAEVVAETFCLCVTNAEDAAGGQLSRIHTALIEEVVKRAQAIATEPAVPESSAEVVDVASEQSFPASDPPAWIWRDRTAWGDAGAA
jgi:hypothetical protein